MESSILRAGNKSIKISSNFFSILISVYIGSKSNILIYVLFPNNIILFKLILKLFIKYSAIFSKIKLNNLALFYKGRMLNILKSVSENRIIIDKKIKLILIPIDCRNRTPISSLRFIKSHQIPNLESNSNERIPNEYTSDFTISEIYPSLNIGQILSDLPIFQSLRLNPDFNFFLNNPENSRIISEIFQNPHRLQDLMRRHDQELRNIESIPGGLNALARSFNEINNPIQDIFDEIICNCQNGLMNSNQTNSISNNIINRVPLTNPWTSNTQLSNINPLNLISSSAELIPNNRLPTIEYSSNFTIDSSYYTSQRNRFSTELNILSIMGFTDHFRNLLALIESNGDIALAIQYLLSNT